MNDLVIVMSGKKLQVDKNGIVTRFRMTLELRAAGAAKTLGPVSASLNSLKI